MTGDDEEDDLRRTWLRFNIDRAEGRAMYAERFGRAFDDPGVDAELTALFNKRRLGMTVIEVPARLLLALVMRPPPGEGRGKKRPPLEKWKRRLGELAVRSAEKEWARRVEEEGPKVSKKAKHDAAVSTHESNSLHGLSVETIKSRMNLERGRSRIAAKK